MSGLPAISIQYTDLLTHTTFNRLSMTLQGMNTTEKLGKTFKNMAIKKL